MADPIIYYNSDMSVSNELATEATVQTLIDASLVAQGLVLFDDAENYTLGDVVVFSGRFYKALANILAGGGDPTTNGDWEKKDKLDYTTTATAGSTTTLTNLSTEIQFFTGTLAQNVDMAVVSTLSLGRQLYIYNKSSGILTIRSSGGNTITTIPAGNFAILTCILITGTTAASWAYDVVGILPASGTNITLSGYLNEAKGSDIASATTTDIGAATGNTVDVTGTTTITGLGTIQAGTRRIVRFTGALTLTHNATSLILPGGANITTVAGDVAVMVSLGSGNWLCTGYLKKTWTGTGGQVNATSPTLVAPILGVATATTINKLTITAPATGSTLTILNGKTLTVNNTMTLAGTDSTTHTFPSTSSSVARIDAAQSFTGTQTFNNYLQLSEIGGILRAQTLSADGKFSISDGEIGTLGETLSVGHLIYFKQSDQRWWKCDADAEATSGPVKLGILCVAGTAGVDCQIMLRGKIRADALFPTFSVGAPVYIGSTAGEVQVAKPTSGFVRVVGYGDTADSLCFDPATSYYELGTFNGTITFGGGSTGNSYGAQSCSYIKYNGSYKFSGTIILTKGSSTGAAKIESLPFTAIKGGASSIGYNSGISHTGQLLLNNSDAETAIKFRSTTTGGTSSDPTNSSFAASITLVFHGEILI